MYCVSQQALWVIDDPSKNDQWIVEPGKVQDNFVASDIEKISGQDSTYRAVLTINQMNFDEDSDKTFKFQVEVIFLIFSDFS